MDEKDLETLFRAAPGDPPQPTFDLGDVTAASARAAARRRSAVLLSVVCLVVVLSAAGIAGLTYFRSTGSQSAQPANALARPSQTLPGPSPLQGSGGNGQDGPRAEGTPTGCEKVDRELATALAGELPATGTTGPLPGRFCPTATRSAGFHVTDGDRGGVISVTFFPAGVAVGEPANTISALQHTASGGTVLVLSFPDASSAPPLQADLAGIAAALAHKLAG
ncbi:hypothetical protein [Amycolatopsis alkalitolerans]|uniref:Uncharacterized protein n=1 Tax=Amycolatopsis alkalitolerans TaxID=2547244 RepID=A0A5C4M0M0_9PSEU|nr:hypothetical protein [Amycolatopsis alkalitolerans]TNC26096.1 hypothetical protein FG385_13085 [Amycolatopsis alkalitolerans]